MRKTCLILIVLIIFSLSISADADGLRWQEIFENDEVEFQTMLTTAYNLHGICANGTPTHAGVCACNPRLGDCAVLYTMDGQYIGIFEVCDKGTTNGLINGKVIDVWFDTMEECKAYMKLTGGKVRVQWISGDG